MTDDDSTRSDGVGQVDEQRPRTDRRGFLRATGASALAASVGPALAASQEVRGAGSAAAGGTWTATVLGDPDDSGSVAVDGNEFDLSVASGNVWDSADEGRYVHREVTGDGAAVARIDSLQNTDEWAKVGLMLRTSLEADARNVFVPHTPGHDTSMQWRAESGGESVSTADGAPDASSLDGGTTEGQWLKLVRSGETITGYASSNGIAWTEIATVSLSLGQTVHIGLALSSNGGGLTSASASEVGVAGFGVSSLVAGDGWDGDRGTVPWRETFGDDGDGTTASAGESTWRVESADAHPQVGVDAAEETLVFAETDGRARLLTEPMAIDAADGVSLSVSVRETGPLDGETGPAQVGADGRPADPDHDGVFEDVDGDGEVTVGDAATLFEHLDADPVTDDPGAFDLSCNDRVDYADVVELAGLPDEDGWDGGTDCGSPGDDRFEVAYLLDGFRYDVHAYGEDRRADPATLDVDDLGGHTLQVVVTAQTATATPVYHVEEIAVEGTDDAAPPTTPQPDPGGEFAFAGEDGITASGEFTAGKRVTLQDSQSRFGAKPTDAPHAFDRQEDGLYTNGDVSNPYADVEAGEVVPVGTDQGYPFDSMDGELRYGDPRGESPPSPDRDAWYYARPAQTGEKDNWLEGVVGWPDPGDDVPPKPRRKVYISWLMRSNWNLYTGDPFDVDRPGVSAKLHRVWADAGDGEGYRFSWTRMHATLSRLGEGAVEPNPSWNSTGWNDFQRWHTMEIEIDYRDGGYTRCYVDGERIHDITIAETNPDWVGSISPRLWGYNPSVFGWEREGMVFELADYYVDSSLARVVLTNADTWAESDVRVNQPHVAWRADRISLDLYPGRLADADTAYLWVVDDDGTPLLAGEVTRSG